MRRRWVTPWTICQFILRPDGDKQPFIVTLAANSEALVNPLHKALDCGRTPEYLEGTHIEMGRTCKVQTERLHRIQPKSFFTHNQVTG